VSATRGGASVTRASVTRASATRADVVPLGMALTDSQHFGSKVPIGAISMPVRGDLLIDSQIAAEFGAERAVDGSCGGKF
jgi:hypothetical protein